MQVKEIFKDIINVDFDLDVAGLAIDSRQVKPNDAFICISGTKVDGHDFAKDAIKNGASLIVTERDLGLNVPQVIVGDTRAALGRIASNFYGNPRERFKLIGITGTNGKTTTSYMIKNILEMAGKKVGVIGTIGVMIGDEKFDSTLTTPDPIELHKIFRQMAEIGVDVVVMEVSAHAIALQKMSGVVCDVGVLTNVTQDHLDFFGTFEKYSATKSSFIKPKFCKIGVVNADDALGMDIVIAMQNCNTPNFKVISYGINSPADNFATNIKYDMNGTHYFLNIFDDLECINTRLIGEFNVYNALAAASACREIGVGMEEIHAGLNTMDFVAGRINVIKLPNGASVVIDYAHTPDGLKNILESVRKITDGKMYCVFGCGGNRDVGKRPIMGSIAAELADFTVITSDNPRLEKPEDIIEDIKAGIISKTSAFTCIPNRISAINYTIKHLIKGDVAVIAGKGAENYLDINGEKIPYSDFETVKEESKKIFDEAIKC